MCPRQDTHVPLEELEMAGFLSHRLCNDVWSRWQGWVFPAGVTEPICLEIPSSSRESLPDVLTHSLTEQEQCGPKEPELES